MHIYKQARLHTALKYKTPDAVHQAFFRQKTCQPILGLDISLPCKVPKYPGQTGYEGGYSVCISCLSCWISSRMRSVQLLRRAGQ